MTDTQALPKQHRFIFIAWLPSIDIGWQMLCKIQIVVKSWLISVLGSKPKGTLYILKYWGAFMTIIKGFFSQGLGTRFGKGEDH